MVLEAVKSNLKVRHLVEEPPRCIIVYHSMERASQGETKLVSEEGSLSCLPSTAQELGA